jgi:hypothetical protein
MTREAPVSLRKLKQALIGGLVLPADRRYGRQRPVRNRAINQGPAMIVRCANQKDVH